MLKRGWRPRKPIKAMPAHTKQQSATSSPGVHEPGFCNFHAGNKAVEAAVATVIVTVWLGVPGVSVTDAGLVGGVVAKVHDASAGSTGHWNPDTTSEPERKIRSRDSQSQSLRAALCDRQCWIGCRDREAGAQLAYERGYVRCTETGGQVIAGSGAVSELTSRRIGKYANWARSIHRTIRAY